MVHSMSFFFIRLLQMLKMAGNQNVKIILTIRGRPLMIWGAEEKSKMNLFFPRQCLLKFIFPHVHCNAFIVSVKYWYLLHTLRFYEP